MPRVPASLSGGTPQHRAPASVQTQQTFEPRADSAPRPLEVTRSWARLATPLPSSSRPKCLGLGVASTRDGAPRAGAAKVRAPQSREGIPPRADALTCHLAGTAHGGDGKGRPRHAAAPAAVYPALGRARPGLRDLPPPM